MRRRWSLGYLSHSLRKGEKPETSGAHPFCHFSSQMRNGLRHWGRNSLDCLEGYFLHEQREVSVVEAVLETGHCLSNSSGCLFGKDFLFGGDSAPFLKQLGPLVSADVELS